MASIFVFNIDVRHLLWLKVSSMKFHDALFWVGLYRTISVSAILLYYHNERTIINLAILQIIWHVLQNFYKNKTCITLTSIISAAYWALALHY